jgi:ketosteroid isomerase-like protein
MTDTPNPTEVVEAYVKAVRAGDFKALRAVFADDAEVLSLPMEGMESGHLKGVDAIVTFFGKLLEDRGGADPHPGPLMVVGDRVAVEIDAHHRDYIEEVSDFFTIKDGKITRLAVYCGRKRPK